MTGSEPPTRIFGDPRAIALVVASVVAAFLYCNFVLDVLVSGPDELLAVVSDLEAPGMPNATLLRVTDAICGVLILVLLPFVHAALPRRRASTAAVWLTAVFAVFNALAGVVTLPCSSDEVCESGSDSIQRSFHDGFSILSAVALFIGAWLIARVLKEQGPAWLRRAGDLTFWVGGILGTVLFGLFGFLDSTSAATGISQRFQLVVSSAWIICLGVYAAAYGLSAAISRASSGRAR